ncbi:hypothetical protein P4T89_03060 [Bacillus nakamurai]|uniref:Uncharacterized protein n=1 Tax=Bacillus nakamurai TaxID=1793963 RepID=A0A150F9A8_9BACI|nr:hypothetical protein [Bacillus nakamurai]KXZ21742.1 hypothetical protein AXI58_12380 [Bacillus nakamurai]MED1226618.1 hypothetical protein [Bacillus nakamurai]
MGIETAAGPIGRMVLQLLFSWSSFTESGVFKTGMYGGAAILLVIGLSMPAVRMFQVLGRGRRSGEPASFNRSGKPAYILMAIPSFPLW